MAITRFNNPYFDFFVDRHAPGVWRPARAKDELNEAFTNLAYYYPHVKTPKSENGDHRFESDIFVSDSLIIIGLDYYLGRRGLQAQYVRLYVKKVQEKFYRSINHALYGIDGQFNKTNLKTTQCWPI